MHAPGSALVAAIDQVEPVVAIIRGAGRGHNNRGCGSMQLGQAGRKQMTPTLTNSRATTTTDTTVEDSTPSALAQMSSCLCIFISHTVSALTCKYTCADTCVVLSIFLVSRHRWFFHNLCSYQFFYNIVIGPSTLAS
jgi:hypothetical protein